MGKVKSVTSLSIVASAYIRVRDNEVAETGYIKGYDGQVGDFENIDTDRFMTYCNLSLGVRRTTAERYLRNFRAKDRWNLKNEKPLVKLAALA
jgi:hypothetical protein